jgi:murein DD-endopeptidase MepM/ murein hydrolase activator NlpD
VLAVALAALVLPCAATAGAAQTTLDDLDDLTERRVELEADLDAVTAELEVLGVRMTETQDARQRLSTDLGDLEDAAGRADAVLAARAVFAYRHVGADPLQAVLDAEGSQHAMARVRVLDGLGHRERQEVERAQLARAAYAQRREQLAHLAASLREDEVRAAELREALQVAFDEAASREDELAGRRGRQRVVSRSGQQGTYACPIAGPFHFRDTWGAPRSGGRSHKGVDMFGQMGADVFAITDGTILRHSSSPLGGLGLYLAGDDGAQYYYSHLQSIFPDYQPGRRVEAGERIAANGDSGNARGGAPHIHFEVRPAAGAQVNPYPFAAAACF